MTDSHVARECAPASSRPPRPPGWEHPIDRIADAQRYIHAVSLLIDYAIEKDAVDEDGVSPQYLSDGLSVIDHFAAEIRRGVDELLSNYDVVERRHG